MVPTTNESVLGQLAVRLIGDNADLLKRVKESDTALRGFVSKAKVNFQNIAKAGTIATGAIAGVAFAISRMAAQATQIKSLSQSLGMTTEEFTGLRYALTQAGVPMEALVGSTIRLTQTMTQVAQGIQGPATQAFTQLGISVRDAEGNMRSTSDVLGDVADKFASYADGANKSALAAQLFGEQGVKLLPVLNQGSDGLKRLADEAKAAGVVLDEETVDQAAKVNAEFQKMGDAFSSAGIKIAAEFLPAIRDVRDLVTSENFHAGVKLVANGINVMTDAFENYNRHSTGNFLDDLREYLSLNEELGNLPEEQRRSIAEQLRGGKSQDQSKVEAPIIDTEAESRLEAIKASAQSAAQSALQDLMDTPTETATAKLEALGEALERGTISWQEFGQMSQRVGKQQEQVLDDLASATASTLTAIFKDNKTAAIAASLINTYQGITKALSAYPPPYNIAMAAMVAAQGLAQVQAIRNTNKNGGGGGTPSVGGGGAGAGGEGGGGGESGGNNIAQTLFVQGFNPRELYSGAAVKELVEVLLQFQRDGGQVLLERA